MPEESNLSIIVFHQLRQRGQRNRDPLGPRVHRQSGSDQLAQRLPRRHAGHDGPDRPQHLEVQNEPDHRRQKRAGPVLLSLPVRPGVSELRPEMRPRRRKRHQVRNLRRGRLLHRRIDPRRRRHRRAAEGVFQDRLRHRPQARRPVHRRRSADRLRPHRRKLLGLRELRRHARHRHDGQGNRQRRAARRMRHAAGDRAR